MAKLSLDAKPTFTAKVGIPVAGSVPVSVEFTFKHRSRDDLNVFLNEAEKRTDEQTMMAMVDGWELDDEFNEANMKRLMQSYIGSTMAVVEAYIAELTQAKRKN